MGYSNQDVAALGPDLSFGGGISVAPKGTALPTTATGALNAAFKHLGLVGEEGLQPSGEAASTTDLRDWSGDVAASVTENKSITRWDISLLSIFDPDVAKFVFGASNVTVTDATVSAGTKLAIQETGDDLDDCVMVITMKSVGGKRVRYVIPNGTPQITGELPAVRNALGGYSIQITAVKDDSGVRVYRYYENDDVLSA